MDANVTFHIGILLMNETHAPSPPVTISQPKIYANALAAGAPPRTPLGKLQRSPDPLAGFFWRRMVREGELGMKEQIKGRGREKG